MGEQTTNSSTGLWSNLISVGGSLGITALQNRGAQIKGQYETDLKKLQNDAALTQAQKDEALLKLNTAFTKATGDIKSQQTKLYIQAAAMVLVLGGVLTVAILLIVRSNKMPQSKKL